MARIRLTNKRRISAFDHTRPPQGVDVVYCGEFDLPKSHAGPKNRHRWAACPCCHPETAWYWKGGKIAWFPEEHVIRMIGGDCFSKITKRATSSQRNNSELTNATVEPEIISFSIWAWFPTPCESSSALCQRCSKWTRFDTFSGPIAFFLRGLRACVGTKCIENVGKAARGDDKNAPATRTPDHISSSHVSATARTSLCSRRTAFSARVR
jgi:hypothetical protein